MNRLFTLCLLSVILFSTAHAQLNKGQWLVGGNVNFSASHSSSNSQGLSSTAKSTTLQASPGAGYFVMNKLAVGLRPGVSINNSNYKYSFTSSGSLSLQSSTSISKSTALDVSPFVRYYFLPQKNKVNLLGELSYTYAHTKTHQELNQVMIIDGQPQANSNVAETKLNGSLYSLFAGPSIFISPKVGLELLAGYTYAKYKGSSTGVNNFGLSAGFQIYLGK